MKYCTEKSHVPNYTHLAVLRFTSVNIPGDERSRTHPGHGYPAENKRIVEYIVFDSAEELNKWVNNHAAVDDFVIIRSEVKSVRVKTTVEIVDLP